MKNKPLNIIVVISHDLGQALNCYGENSIRSPHIDAFAEQGLRFVKSFCCAPQCSPSRAGLWTGRFPHANGVVGLAHYWFENDLNPDEQHFSQVLKDAGYETHLFGVQHETPDPEKRLGYDQLHPVEMGPNLGESVSELLTSRKQDEPPLFISMGLFEPHRPFPHERIDPIPPEDIQVPGYLPDIPVVREDWSAFEASVASMDLGFGKMMEALDSSEIADNTLVVFTADHGIPFNRCKMSLYDKGIEVPLIFRGPGVPAGEVDDGHLISNVDVMPTLLELIDQPQPDHLQGRSFAGLLSGDNYEPNDAVYGEMTYHTYYDPMRCVRTEKWKLIANFECAPAQMSIPDLENNGKGYPEMCLAMGQDGYHRPLELFDLETDPHEQTNLADDPEYRETRDGLIRQLRDWMERTGDPLLEGPIAQGAYHKRMGAFQSI